MLYPDTHRHAFSPSPSHTDKCIPCHCLRFAALSAARQACSLRFLFLGQLLGLVFLHLFVCVRARERTDRE